MHRQSFRCATPLRGGSGLGPLRDGRGGDACGGRGCGGPDRGRPGAGEQGLGRGHERRNPGGREADPGGRPPGRLCLLCTGRCPARRDIGTGHQPTAPKGRSGRQPSLRRPRQGQGARGRARDIGGTVGPGIAHTWSGARLPAAEVGCDLQASPREPDPVSLGGSSCPPVRPPASSLAVSSASSRTRRASARSSCTRRNASP